MSNKIMCFLMEVVGLLLLGYFVFSDLVFVEKLFGLLGSLFLFGYPISISEDKKRKEIYQEGRKEGLELIVGLEDLKPGNYFFSGPATQKRDNPYVARYIAHYFWVECIEGMIAIKIDKSDRDKIAEAIGKSVDQIEGGEKFKINEDHNITRT